MSYISKANSDGYDFGFTLGFIFIFVIPGWFIACLFYPVLFAITGVALAALLTVWIVNIVKESQQVKTARREDKKQEQSELRDWFNSLTVEERAVLIKDGTVTLTDAQTGRKVDPSPYLMK